MEKEIKEDIKSARQCLEFRNINCNNLDCKNIYCPLSKIWGKKNGKS